MADKTPVRVVFNSSNVATGMAEFQSGETVPVANGGTGLGAIGSAGQIIKVNAAGNALEFGAEGDISITNLVAPTNSDLTLTTSGTGNIVLDAITFRGTTISSADSSIININEGVVVGGTLNTSGQATLSGLAYPTSDGTVGQFLKTDGSGTLAFADLSLGDLTIIGSTISAPSNADLSLQPGGTGDVLLSALRINGTTLDSSDSTKITIAEAVDVTGALVVGTSINIAGDGATVTGIKDEDDMSSNSATKLATQQSIKAYVDSSILTKDNTDEIAEGSTNLYFTNARADARITAALIDEDNMASNSDTRLPSQQSVKAYVDAQITAEDLDFQADSGGALSIDLDSETMTFTGGTGIDTSGSGNAVTFAIDSTVATLTGSQTLTNKTLTNPTINAATMTGAVAIDGVTIDDNKVTSNASDSNLELDASGSGSVRLVAPTTAVSTLTTADIATTGTHTITGQLDAESVRIKDNTITTNATNANLELTANGTGVVDVKKAMTTIGQTITGNVVIDGQFDVDNISINGNGIIATNSGGGININPNATGQVTIGGTIVQIPGLMAATDINVTSNVLLGADCLITTDVSNADINIDANGTGSVYIDELRFRDNNITTHVTNANLELTTDGTGTIELQTATNVTGNLTVSGAFIGSRQTISGAGAINLTTLYTEITTTGANAYTLANGVIGQMKIIVMVVDGGDATITPTTFANGTRIVMDAVHDSVTLIYGASGWQVIASRDATVS